MSTSHHFYSSKKLYCFSRQDFFSPHSTLYSLHKECILMALLPGLSTLSAFLCSWLIWKAKMAFTAKDFVLSPPCNILKRGISWVYTSAVRVLT